jgi:transcriptional regulator with XRE-family HTH domain
VEDRYKRLLLYLRESRKRAGISQIALAKKLRRSQSFVSKYERGEQMLSVMDFYDITHAIGVKASDCINHLR